MVRRTRLEDLLSRGAAGPITLISAGAGSGKTMTAATWAQTGQQPGRLGWLSLDTADNDHRTFWTGVLGALTASGAVPSDSPLRDIIPASGFGMPEALGIRNRLHQLSERTVLVLDDFHTVTSPAVLGSLGRLLDYHPPQLGIVLITRNDPNLPLHRARVRGELTEIRTRDLAFTDPEAVELFKLHGLRLTEQQLEVLQSRTEGWPAGLRLAAMSLDAAGIDDSIARFSGTDRAVSDYLTSELIDRLAPDELDFLFRTSVVQVVCGDLANRLTGRDDSQLVLEKLIGANAFVVALGGPGEWYSYHPLLRELLQHRLAYRDPTAVPRLHRSAAEWFASRGDLVQAITHAVRAGDRPLMMRMVLLALPGVLSVQGPAIATALKPLAVTAPTAPSLISLLAAAICHFQDHNYSAMHRDALEAEQYLSQAEKGGRAAAELVIALFEMVAARSRGAHSSYVGEARRVIDILDRTPRHQIEASRHFRAASTNNLGVGQVWSGELAVAEATLSTAVRDTGELGLPLVQLNAIGFRAVVHALTGRLRQTDTAARGALQIVERHGWGSEPQALPIYLALAMGSLTAHNLPEAAAQLDRGLVANRALNDPTLRVAFGVTAVRLAVSRGDDAAAAAAVRRLRSELSRTTDPAPLLLRWAAVATAEAALVAEQFDEALSLCPAPGPRDTPPWERVCRARIQLGRGHPDAAAQLVEPLLAADREPSEWVIEALLVRAVVEHRRHSDDAALRALDEAVELAAPDGILRPFAVIAQPIAGLLARHQERSGNHQEFISAAIAALSDVPTVDDAHTSVTGRLTRRETIVLRYLPTMLSAGEIAADLFVSVNTVKAQIRSIYAKLGVTRRRDAVEHAQRSGLL